MAAIKNRNLIVTNRIVIAGAGGFGREVHSWIDSSPRFREEMAISKVVFINDGAADRPIRAPLVSRIDEFQPEPNDLLICAIGSPKGRRKVVDSLVSRGGRFTTFVHDSVVIGANVEMGNGVVLCPGVIVGCDISIGDHTHVNLNSSIGHDVRIGQFVTISPACNLMGGVIVNDNVFLGTAATIVPGRTIHHDTVIGAGSVVVKDIESEVVAFGNPCRVSSKSTR